MRSRLFRGIFLSVLVSGMLLCYQQAQKVYTFFPEVAEQPRHAPGHLRYGGGAKPTLAEPRGCAFRLRVCLKVWGSELPVQRPACHHEIYKACLDSNSMKTHRLLKLVLGKLWFIMRIFRYFWRPGSIRGSGLWAAAVRR